MITITFSVPKTQQEIIDAFDKLAKEIPPIEGQSVVQLSLPDTIYHWTLDAKGFFDKHQPGTYEEMING